MNEQQRTWLDSHGIKLTTAAARRFAAVWRDVHDRHSDNHIREATLIAAAHYLDSGADLAKLGKALARARAKAEEQLAVARIVATLAIEDGKSELSTSREIGVDRMAVRDWLGKR